MEIKNGMEIMAMAISKAMREKGWEVEAKGDTVYVNSFKFTVELIEQPLNKKVADSQACDCRRVKHCIWQKDHPCNDQCHRYAASY